MTTRTMLAAVCTIAMLPGVVSIHAGGALESYDITGNIPSPIPGHIVARVIGIKWDIRAVPVKYSVNNTLNPIPNPLGPASLSLSGATAALQAAFDTWNNVPTSFIDMQITGTRSNPGLRGFDFVNELTFRTSGAFGAIASSPSVSLIVDSTFSQGDDIDGDGDSDVSNGIAVTTDVDNDGDLEFPAGFYKAGTILDNDVEFNTKVSNGVRFTTDPAAVDTVVRSVDLVGVAVHEFGHSHGLSHSLNNQNGLADGAGAVMFPSIDTGDPASELALRVLDIDDVAYSSFFYPEGTAKSGRAALQRGDTAFSRVFGLIRGELTHGVLEQPVAGGNVFTVNERRHTASTSAFSGTTQLSVNPATGGLFLIDPAFNILDGKYVIPVPRGRYTVGVEAVDGSPVSAGLISLTTQIGSIFGQHNFNEEFTDTDGDDESGSDSDARISVDAGETRRHVDIVTSRDTNIDNFGNATNIGFINVPAGSIYAVRVPATQISQVNPGGDILVNAVAFHTAVVDASVVPVFAEAMLTTGVVNPNGTVSSIDLEHPLARTRGFIGQDDDFAPLFFRNARSLGRNVQRGIASGTIQNLFIVLRLPSTAPFPGVSGQPPLMGLSGAGPIFGFSFFSSDGGATYIRLNNLNFRFSLRLGVPAPANMEEDDEQDDDDD